MFGRLHNAPRPPARQEAAARSQRTARAPDGAGGAGATPALARPLHCKSGQCRRCPSSTVRLRGGSVLLAHFPSPGALLLSLHCWHSFQLCLRQCISSVIHCLTRGLCSGSAPLFHIVVSWKICKCPVIFYGFISCTKCPAGSLMSSRYSL